MLLTGTRQAGNTTLAWQLAAGIEPAQYLNWDDPADRVVIADQTWPHKAKLRVFDKIRRRRRPLALRSARPI